MKSEVSAQRSEVSDPKISVCRGSRVIGYFDGFTMVRDWVPYEDEHEGIRQAVEWFKARSEKVPEVLYPRVTVKLER